VNKQNGWFWAANNPHGLHQRPLHSVKVTVSSQIIGPYFIEDEEGQTVNVEQYMAMLEKSLQNELYPYRLNSLWF
jgi:hypothetical protein